MRISDWPAAPTTGPFRPTGCRYDGSANGPPGAMMQFNVLLTLAATAVFASSASGQEPARTWPTRNVTMVVAFAPGGPLDGLARNLQPYLSETLGRHVIIENVAG